MAGELCKSLYLVRNDCPCGSTIGPILSTNTGICTVDLGMPQLSIRSCREVMMGFVDFTHGFVLFKIDVFCAY